MSRTARAKLSLIPSTPTLESPAGLGPEPEPRHTQAAAKRCISAWRRAYKNCIDNGPVKTAVSDYFPALDAGEAFRDAMPLLSTHENIQDFIACTDLGVLNNSIPPQQSGAFLYAAQVALCALNSSPRWRWCAGEIGVPPPTPSKSPVSRMANKL